jgi:hypothetical protein
VRDDLNIALRAGDGDATSETRSLFGIGVVRDVYHIAGTALAAVALGYEADWAFPQEGTLTWSIETATSDPSFPATGRRSRQRRRESGGDRDLAVGAVDAVDQLERGRESSGELQQPGLHRAAVGERGEPLRGALGARGRRCPTRRRQGPTPP